MRFRRHSTAREQISLFPEIPLAPTKHCRGCKRVISQENSLRRGYGPVCWINRLEKMIKEGDVPAMPLPLPTKRPK